VKPVLATFEQSLIVKEMGGLSASDQDALRTALTRIVG
jgi:hypothetical protein